jgi:hypothetical protein
MVAAALFVPDDLLKANRDRRRSPGDILSDRDAEPRDRWPLAVIFPLGVVAPMLGAARNMLERTIAGLDKKAVTSWIINGNATPRWCSSKLEKLRSRSIRHFYTCFTSPTRSMILRRR